MATYAQALPTHISPLRRVLQADAAVGLVSGVALLVDAGPIATLVGGFSPLAIEVIGARCLAAAVLFTSWLPLTGAGWWLVLAQALVVDVFAIAQL